MEIIERFKEYIKSISKEDKVAIFYHSFCVDGLCACVITSKAIEKITKVKPSFYIHYTKYEITEDIIKFIKENRITKAIFVDLSLDIKPERVRKAEEYTNLLIIDHHKTINDLNSKKTVFCHSEFIKKDLDSAQYPASKLCYDLFSKIDNIEELDWLAAVGLVGDIGYDYWKDFVIEVENKYNLKKDENVFDTEIGKATTLISTSKMYLGNGDVAFDTVYNANKVQDILKDKTLKKYKKACKSELNEWVKSRNKAEKHGDLIIYEIKPKYKIGSTLSTILSTDYFKGKTIIVIADIIGEELLSVSARDQRKIIKLHEFLRGVIKGLNNASAGGHIPAAAAKIRREDLEVFKKKLIEAYNNLSK